MKKVLSIILSAALLLTLYGCGASENEESMPSFESSSSNVALEESVPEETGLLTSSAEENAHFSGKLGIIDGAEAVNIRTEPDATSDIVARFDMGKVVQVFEKKLADGTYWGRIPEGWICLDYVSLTDTALKLIPTSGDATALNGPENPHEYISVVTAPTCTTKGYTTFTCECGHVYKDCYIKSLDHDWSEWETVLFPTEFDEGKNERTCGRCKTVQTEAISKTPTTHVHQYTPKVTKDPTCYDWGIRTFVCSCGNTYTEPVAKAAHSYTTKDVSPTCDSEGYTVHTCSVCGESYSDNFTAAYGHNWQHQHQAAITHEVTYVKCNCGWSALYDNGAGQAAHSGHLNSFPPAEAGNHNSYTDTETVIDVPAKDWDVCLFCGVTR